MSFIPFQNEVRTEFTWQNRPAQPRAFSRVRFSRQIKNEDGASFAKCYACATRPRLQGLLFHLGTEFVFSLHDTRMKCHTRTRISFALKIGMNSFRKDLCGNEKNFISVPCKRIQRGNIWGWNKLVLEWKSFRYHVNGPRLSFQTWPWLHCVSKFGWNVENR